MTELAQGCVRWAGRGVLTCARPILPGQVKLPQQLQLCFLLAEGLGVFSCNNIWLLRPIPVFALPWTCSCATVSWLCSHSFAFAILQSDSSLEVRDMLTSLTSQHTRTRTRTQSFLVLACPLFLPPPRFRDLALVPAPPCCAQGAPPSSSQQGRSQ